MELILLANSYRFIVDYIRGRFRADSYISPDFVIWEVTLCPVFARRHFDFAALEHIDIILA